MYGRVFKILKDNSKMISVFVSFGGLILKLSGKTEELDKFGDDQRVYLMMRKA
jgi:DNA-directed RNA polymerase I, II, and III subunit RPABC3